MKLNPTLLFNGFCSGGLLPLLLLLLSGCQKHQHTPSISTSSSSQVTDEPPRVVLDGGIEVCVQDGEVVLPGSVALDRGWLEVVACIEGTREHEAVFVTAVKPAFVHAALLLVGGEPGTPAQYNATTQTSVSASGTTVDVSLEWNDSDGGTVRRAVHELVEMQGQASLPTFVFAGSLTRPNPPSKGPGEYYVADYGGTIVGLATFGDEVVATQKVHSPDLGIQPAAWRITPETLPAPGTPARLVLRVHTKIK